MVTTAQGQAWLTNGLVAYYPFNGSGVDASGNGIHLVNHGATLQPDRFGMPGRSYWFDGTGYLASTSAFPIVSNMARTVSLWCYRTNIQDGILLRWGDNASHGRASRLLFLVPGVFQANGIYSDVTSVRTSMDVGTGHWLHLAYTYSNSLSGIRLYTNGVAIPSYISASEFSSWNTTTNTPLYVGYEPANPYLRWIGALDDIRIYNRALSSNEVAQLYFVESNSSIMIHKAVYVDSSNLTFGSNYQFQVSSDMVNWTNQGAPFTATDSYWRPTNYWDVENWNALFFRLVPQ